MPQAKQTPALVNWIGYLAITLLLVLPLSVLTVPSGAWQQGLLLYALSCLGCLLLSMKLCLGLSLGMELCCQLSLRPVASGHFECVADARLNP